VLRFEGRIDQVSDLCGEKLNPRMVSAAIEHGQRVVARTFDFALLAPVAGDPPGYCLYADAAEDSVLERLCAAVERQLCESHGYGYARALGQLAPLRVVPVRDGAARYILARRGTGQRAGDIKPAHLDTRLDWTAVFESSSATVSSPIEVTS
jgi:hypothetical protein